MKKILITGVNGFVANHFLDFLEQNQIKSEVLGLDVIEFLNKTDYKNIIFKYHKIDLLNTEEIDNILYLFQPDYILHLASYSSVAFSWKNPVLSFQNNTNIFLNLVETIRRYQFKTRILSIGSSEEYGNINKDNLPLKETAPLDPLSPYAIARVSQEMLSKLYACSYGLDIVMTRSFNHIGPGQSDVFVVSSFVKRVLEKIKSQQEVTLVTGDLSIIRDFLDVRDVVNAYYLLLEKGVSGEVYNVCSGTPIELKELVAKIGELLNVEIKIEVNPEFIRPNDNKIIVGDNSKLNAIGWKQSISLEKSIQDIADYWKNRI